MRNLLAPIGVIAVLATVLIGIVLRSPDTHSNLWTTVHAGYARTSPVYVGQPPIGDVELSLDAPRAQARAGVSLDPGRALFVTRSCATCHGLDARGGPVGPSLAGAATDTVEHMVRKGPGGMPAYKVHLTDPELASVTAYLQTLEVTRPDSAEIAALQRLTYDPSVPVDVLLKGKAAIRRSCGACHAQPGKEDILRAFDSDAEAAGLVAEMVYETNLSQQDAEAIAHYMLAIINGADPVKAP